MRFVLETINQGTLQHIVRRKCVVGCYVRQDTTTRVCRRGRVFEKTPFFARFRAFWVEVGEVIVEVWKSVAEATKMPDKRKHLYVGIVIGLVFGCLFGVSIGFAAGCLAGAIKEWWDSKGHGTVEIMDFIFTAIGALCGACLSIPAIMLYHLIIEIWQR